MCSCAFSRVCHHFAPSSIVWQCIMDIRLTHMISMILFASKVCLVLAAGDDNGGTSSSNDGQPCPAPYAQGSTCVLRNGQHVVNTNATGNIGTSTSYRSCQLQLPLTFQGDASVCPTIIVELDAPSESNGSGKANWQWRDLYFDYDYIWRDNRWSKVRKITRMRRRREKNQTSTAKNPKGP